MDYRVRDQPTQAASLKSSRPCVGPGIQACSRIAPDPGKGEYQETRWLGQAQSGRNGLTENPGHGSSCAAAALGKSPRGCGPSPLAGARLADTPSTHLGAIRLISHVLSSAVNLRDKIEQMMTRRRSVPSAEVDALMIEASFKCRWGGRNHAIYSHPLLERNVSIKQTSPLLPTYVSTALRAIEEVLDHEER